MLRHWLGGAIAAAALLGCGGAHLPEVREVPTTVRASTDTTGLKPAVYRFTAVIQGVRLQADQTVVPFTETVEGEVTVLSPELFRLTSTRGSCRKEVKDKTMPRISYIAFDCRTVRLNARQVEGKFIDATLDVPVPQHKRTVTTCTKYETDPVTGRTGKCIASESRPVVDMEWQSQSVALTTRD